MITSQILVKSIGGYIGVWNPDVIDDSTNGVWCMADTTKVGISLTWPNELLYIDTTKWVVYGWLAKIIWYMHKWPMSWCMGETSKCESVWVNDQNNQCVGEW